jgi:drug/metabolite transporter superfamily protein YnfA
MPVKMTNESIWLVVTIIMVVAIFLILMTIMSGASPGGIFGAIQGFFSAIAFYMMAQLKTILR